MSAARPVQARWRRVRLWLLALPLLLVGAALVSVLVAAAVALQAAPLIDEREPANAEDLQRALQLLSEHDPRRQVPGLRRLLILSARDLDLVVHHAARRWPGARARVSLVPQQARIVFSAPLPAGRWLNLDVELLETRGLPRLHRARLGPLNLPLALVEPLGRDLVQRHPQGSQALELLAMVQQVWIFREGVRVQYTWDAQVPERLLSGVLPPPQQARLRAYVDNIAALARPLDERGTLPLCRLMASSFTLARTRSQIDGGDAAAENRAALLAMTMYANRRNLGKLMPAARGWPTPRLVPVLLSGREDLAQHLLVSALLAIEDSSPLSKVVGVYKEVSDSRGGSGFSFDDLTADRVGTRLGDTAQSQPEALQTKLASCARDEQLMPAFADLPSGLSAEAFRARYGEVGSPAYKETLRLIDSRIQAMPLWP